MFTIKVTEQNVLLSVQTLPHSESDPGLTFILPALDKNHTAIVTLTQGTPGVQTYFVPNQYYRVILGYCNAIVLVTVGTMLYM